MNAGRATAHDDHEALAKFCEFCRRLYDRHLVSGVGGNVSLREGGRIYLTPSGYSLGEVRPETVILFQDGRYVPEDLKPTQDANMHRAILSARGDIHAVCHVHGAYIVAASTLFLPGPDSLPPLTPGFVYFAYPLPMLPFMIPGSDTLASAVGKSLSGNSSRAVLLQNHGLVTIGKDFQEALHIAEEIDEAARVYVLTHGNARSIAPDHLSKIG